MVGFQVLSVLAGESIQALICGWIKCCNCKGEDEVPN